MKIQTIFGVRISQPPFLAFVSRRICQTMRLMILATLVSLACQNSGAQPFATVNFGNKSTCLVTNQLTGNPVNVGDGIKAALYWAELGSTNFVQLFDYYSATVGVPLPGLFAGGTRVQIGTPGGVAYQFQVRAWETNFGATYELAQANTTPQNGRLALLGESSIIQAETGNPAGNPPTPPGSLTASGLTGFSVRLNTPPDTTPPVLTCSTNLVVTAAPGECDATVTYTVTATDDWDPAPALVCVPPSGSSFPVGRTTVFCTAWDASGNTNTCAFTVSVYPSERLGPAGATWTARMTDANRNWRAVASSADGIKLVAVVDGGPMLISDDSGANWTPIRGDTSWTCIASSADGATLIAGIWEGPIIVTWDRGFNWIGHPVSQRWWSVASSADGSKLVAAAQDGGYLWTSADYGGTWYPHDSARNWKSVASSADGSKLVAGVWEGQLYTSTDSGVSWSPRDSIRNWLSVASSADGTKLVAAPWWDQIYTSTNSGANWTPRDSTRTWRAVASSADGSYLAAVVDGGPICTSTNSGETWTEHESTRSWSSIASSADGSSLVAAVMGGQIYTSTGLPIPYTNPPTILGATDLVLEATGPGGAIATFIVTAENLCQPDVPVTCTPPAGSTFPVGTNTVTCVAVDGLGLTNTATFTVTVLSLADTLAEALDTTYLTWTTGGHANWFAQTTNTHDGVDAAASGTITHSKTTWLQTAVTVPACELATLSFWWQVSSEGDYDFLELFIDGVWQDGISGEVAWQQKTYTLAGGSHTLQWQYRKDGSVNTGADRGWVDQVQVAYGGPAPLTFVGATNQIIEATGPGFAIPTFSVTATNVCEPNAPVICTPPSGIPFPLGITTVACEAFFGVTNTTTFTVTVRDTTPPALTVPLSQTVIADPGECEALVSFAAPTATDVCDPNPVVTCAVPSPIVLPVGRTNILCTATDASGNSTNRTFSVSVYPYGAIGPAGAIWTPQESYGNWSSVASSADGTKLVAADPGGLIYTSPDSGTNWIARESSRDWRSVASSADGSRLVAVDAGFGMGGLIYTSADAGTNWTPTSAPSTNWTCVASSADGVRLVAMSDDPMDPFLGGRIYTSSDAGATWTETSAPSTNWTSVASSADGTRLVAVNSDVFGLGGGLIYTSTDAGTTWTETSAPSINWSCVASSADGSRLVAAVQGGRIYTSTTSGALWAPRDSNRNWISVASSADGGKLIAADQGGQLYTSVGTPTPLTIPPTILGATNQVVEATSPGTGNTTYDTTPNQLHGTLANGPVRIGSTLPLGGYALAFDGWDDYVSVPSGINLSNSSFTVEAWAQRDTSANFDVIVGQGTGALNQGLHFGFRENGQFTFAFWANDLDTPATYTDTAWHHWAGTYDAVTKLRCIYRDGLLVTNDTATANYTGTGPLVIGDFATGGVPFDGTLDEVRIWNAARTEAEIQASMNQPLAGTESGLLAYYRFDEADVVFSVTATNVCQPYVPVTCTPPSGNIPLGTNTVITVAVDALGRTNTATFTVTVLLDSPPELTCPSNLVVTAEPGQCEATVTFSVTATDDRDPNPTVVCLPASGSVLPVGRTTVLCTAVDFSGNTNTCSFVVSVYPDGGLVPPTILGATNQVVDATAPGTGITTYDASPNQLHGSLVNGPARIVSTLPLGGYALDCDGGDDYVQITGCPQLEMTVNYTLECWFKADSFGGTGGLRGLVSKYRNNAANGYLLRLTGNDLDFDEKTTSGLNLQAGVWYHVAAVNDNGTRHLYLNGQEVSLNGSALTVQANNDPLCLGTDYLVGSGRCFDGQMDEVRIWNVARTTNDILESMSQPLTGAEPGLVAYYRFDEAAAVFSVTATNVCQPNVPVTCTPPSGSTLPLGTNTVTCVAVDALGQTNTASFTVVVRDARPPAIVTQPVSQEVRPGTNVTFCVTATGAAPLDYQWRKDGANLVDGGRIAGATNACLTIANAVESDSGAYSVTVTNAYGATNSLDATLWVTALDHFTWSTVASPQTAGTPFPVTVTARDQFNNVDTYFTGTVGLSALILGAGESPIVITEIDPNTPDFVEFMNVSAAPVNISGWQLTLYDISTYPNPLINFVVPGGTVVPASGVFRLEEYGTAPGAYPHFYTGANINWLAGTGYPTAVLVRDAAGNLKDFACIGSAVSTAISSPVTIPTNQWTGSSIPGTGNGANNYQRAGNQDHQNNTDWVTATPSPGTINAGLTVPFDTAIAITPTNSGTFVNGVWSGAITVLDPATNLVLTATHSSGYRGTSNPFDVVFRPPSPVFVGCSVPVPGQFQLQANGTAGLTYTLQTSTNLVDWVNHTNVVADPGGLIEYLEIMETNAPACFYRLRWP